VDLKNELWHATSGSPVGRMPLPVPIACAPHPRGSPSEASEGRSGLAEHNGEHRNSDRAALYRALVVIAASTSAVPINTCGSQ
jgi:hypothetical protein